jgi:hypothetical protein
MKFFRQFLRFVPALIIAAALPLAAREVSITVIDADLELPLEGARIRVVGGAQGQEAEQGEYECDENGTAVVRLPDDRQAVVQAAYPGYESARLVIPQTGDSFTLAMRLGGVLEGKELVIEARKPAESESRVGRSVTISGAEITQSAQMGIVEDVMNAIKLLPGVGFTGMFNAQPSIRGGDPGDLTAALDGYYVAEPYHWGGGFSIFDPAMTASARLSHGVFSARYGHTISGLLEITSKKASPQEVIFDLGLSSSAVNVNLSYPLNGKGGVMLMGKITYWDPYVLLLKQFVDVVNYVRVAPYIRDFALNANYRFTDNLELRGSLFIGSDGVSGYWDNPSEVDYAEKIENDMSGEWENLLGYALVGLAWNPTNAMLLKSTAGGGFYRRALDAYMTNNIVGVHYSPVFIAQYGGLFGITAGSKYSLKNDIRENYTETNADVQWRADYDWNFAEGFMFAAGAEERYLWNIVDDDASVWNEEFVPDLSTVPGLSLPAVPGFLHYPVSYTNHTQSGALDSSLYALLEYQSPKRVFSAELGLRLDHLLYIGTDQTIQTLPAVNPRLNIDIVALKDKGVISALTFTAGTGLFSSMTDSLFTIRRDNNIADFELKQNRASTSVAGAKIDFLGGVSLTIEGYYKYVFDRAYRWVTVESSGAFAADARSTFKFDGVGHIWGIDVMLQRRESRWVDGWLAYSFNWARYKNPGDRALGANESAAFLGSVNAGEWFWPSFHRFHTLNLVLNIKPSQTFTIYTRLGFASGTPENEMGSITSYPVVLPDGTVIEKWKRESKSTATRMDAKRTPFALPMDIKFSWHLTGAAKTKTEIYLAAENVLWFVNTGERNKSFNTYTGEEEEGSMNANYGLPVPMVSLGLKWSY